MTKKITPCFKIILTKNIRLALVCTALFFGAAASAQTTRYVKPAAAGTGDGSSWDNAASDIQLMINTSVKGDAIWVAGGTYKAIRKANDTSIIALNDRDNAFVLKDSVQLYGGFAGTELLLADRDLTIAANTSTLSADFNDDDTFEMSGDTLSIGNNAENAYHVLIGVAVNEAASIDAFTRVDGFTIKGGNANDAAFTTITVGTVTIYRYAGGGLINRAYSRPTITNVVFTGNNALYGGAIYNRTYSDILLENANIIQNTATLGAGITNWLNCSPTINNTVVQQNRADAGAGIYNLTNCNPVLNVVTISNNFATIGSGGAMFNNASSPVLTDVSIFDNVSGISGGGIFNTTGSSPVITDSSISQNSAPTGGGVFSSGNCNAVLTDVIIAQNEATAGNGGGYYNYQSVPVFNNVEIAENTATQFGGGLANFTQAPAVVNNSLITGNTATNGAGVFNYDGSAAVYTNVIFTDNEATGTGGGAYNRDANPIYTNCLFTGNMANYGGGIYNLEEAEPVITNATITQNFAITFGGGISSDNASPQIRNSILAENASTTSENPNSFTFNDADPTYAYSLVEGTTLGGWNAFGTDGGNNMDTDPLFADPDGDDFNLTAESPAVNHGSNAYYAEGLTPDLSLITTDLAGNIRFYDATPIDMGAYELQQFVSAPSFNQLQVTCYPNPVVNYLNIQAKDAVTGVKVYNMLGQEVKNATWNKTNNTVDMATVQTGSYFVKVTIGNASKSVTIVKK
ncbi:MAG: T9SS type A sorting domain-containing protein [Bacteroidota bacterium]